MNMIPFHIKEEPKPYDYVSQIQKLMSAGIEIDKKWLFKQFSLDYNEEKQKMQKEYDQVYKGKVNNQVFEAMEKDKFIDGKTTHPGTLNKCSTDLAAIKQVAGIDWGKENSKSVGTVSQYWLNGSAESFPQNNWECHPLYLELKKNIDVKCEIDNNGKITGTVVSNLYTSYRWFLDFKERCYSNFAVRSMISGQNPEYQGLLDFEIQLGEYLTETKYVPQPFYLDCAVCNQCDKQDVYKPKTENYTCQKCWPR